MSQCAHSAKVQGVAKLSSSIERTENVPSGNIVQQLRCTACFYISQFQVTKAQIGRKLARQLMATSATTHEPCKRGAMPRDFMTYSTFLLISLKQTIQKPSVGIALSIRAARLFQIATPLWVIVPASLKFTIMAQNDSGGLP